MIKLDFKYITIFLCLLLFAAMVFIVVEMPAESKIRKVKQMPDQVMRFKVFSPGKKDTSTIFVLIPYKKIFFIPKL